MHDLYEKYTDWEKRTDSNKCVRPDLGWDCGAGLGLIIAASSNNPQCEASISSTQRMHIYLFFGRTSDPHRPGA